MNDAKAYARAHSYRIPMLDAAVIFRLNVAGGGLRLYARVKDTKGNETYKPNTALYGGALKYCLETETLESVYRETFRVKSFCSTVGDHRYTDAIVSVSFDSTFKEYNRFGKVEGYDGDGKLYVKAGYRYENGRIVDGDGNPFDITDGICLCGDEILAVVTLVSVEKNQLPDGCRCFAFDEAAQCYVFKTEKTMLDTFALRSLLYENGFTLLNAKGKPVDYVRYKRSAGMSRSGKCYFIRKELFKRMMAWSDFNPGKSRLASELRKYRLTPHADPVAHEAYTALTLSTLEDTVEIPLPSILFVKDVKASSFTKAVHVKNEGGKVVAKREEIELQSVLWDGEALLDTSVFAQAGRSDKGMMLLRNRHFKSCAFHTNLQKWFVDNKIKEVAQLNGFTLATEVAQIQMIVTESSLKFLKLFDGEFEDKTRYWIDRLQSDGGSTFGIVKSEKPTKLAGGQMVRTSYQLINTINLTAEEAKTLVAPIHDLKQKLRSDPTAMKAYLDECCIEGSAADPLHFKKKLVAEILEACPAFAETRMYYGFRNDVIQEINDAVKRGRLPVHGTNAVLFGNGEDLLLAATFKNYNPVRYIIDRADDVLIHAPFFKDGGRILCARSPHITMGNVLVADQTAPKFGRYFHLTENIVCVNAIGSTVQHRLNGCDYDSDVMLITDDSVLSQAAIRDYGSFPVPFNGLAFAPAENKSLAEIDRLISENKIGEIVNLSQKLNTIFWVARNTRGLHIIPAFELYNDICILAVLSNTEIDKAKRIYDVDVDAVLDALKAKYLGVFGKYFNEPEFWKSIRISDGKAGDPSKWNDCPAPMVYLYKEAAVDRAPKSRNGKYFADLPGVDFGKIKGVRQDEIEKMLFIAAGTAAAYNPTVMKLRSAAARRGRHGQYDPDAGMRDLAAILASGIERISKLCKTDAHRLAALRAIDAAVRTQKEAKTEQWVLLAGVWKVLSDSLLPKFMG